MDKKYMKHIAAVAVSFVMAQSITWANTLDATADIRFKGSSTLHDFEGAAAAKPFVADFKENDESGQLTVAAKTAIEVGTMTTNNKKRDKNMFKMFDLDHFGRIEGELPETQVSEKGRSEANLHLKICNVEHDVTATISEVQRDGNELSCNMTFPVSLKAFHLKGPSVMGVIRVDDTVYVECTIHGQIGETIAGK